MNREAAIGKFLAAHGWGAADRRVLAEDASFRRYFRLRGGAVLMDAPPPREDIAPFLHIQAHLARIGLSVPAVLAADPAQGLVLLEDFGDTLFPAVMGEATTGGLYDAATDTLVVMHQAPPPPGLPAWDADAMTAAAATFLDWWWPARVGRPADDGVRTAFAIAMRAMLAPLRHGPHGFVHRDYFAGNLFALPRAEHRRTGVIDFQDAAIGHPAYDLVSLVEDARRDLPEGLAERQVGRYLAARSALAAESFRTAYAVCAVQRHLRVAGLWVRLARRDGKPGYLVHGPRTWRRLETALRVPAAAPVAEFLDRHVTPELRGAAS